MIPLEKETTILQGEKATCGGWFDFDLQIFVIDKVI